ncbi:hypothetical protein LFAB_11165 [Lactiplantibacillus fabifermentans T30PCM01]|uniref:Uncharacterized protein n=1 Tax=Lactiplantibacillus fabifermentans T30PCM01 TaxID=1400520 RepID=W6T771_9LACO|nr:hypothetical protein LFAB_11165 [Lactiplantibacillus fabifermentans T30PCM01]
MRNYKYLAYSGISAVYLLAAYALFHLVRLAYFLFII